jgi:hypothetical protein
MQGRLIKFQKHIKVENYALNNTSELALKRKHECFINPHYVIGIDPKEEAYFGESKMFYVSAKDYCRIITANGGVWEVDGTLEQVAEQVYHGKGIEYPVR